MTATAIPETPIKPDNLVSHGYGLERDRSWITFNGRRVLWLPSEVRPNCFALHGRMMCIGCFSGQVLFISFSRDV
ncbi:hypothetical protein F5144DRAFT_583058 [Chaetomium tenue]|uniref:Uncharacterized protein n=1 Tax=Chaetomium tenue TaxID=1854479 RepID=A0ACB7NY52_9PEZI|nr:hypothetical protein F5144DRAFT_583058 [Chaetomium globosum]